MIQTNEGYSSLNDQDNLNSSLGTSDDNEQSKEITNDLGNTTFTQEEIEQANKPQPNVITSATGNSVGKSDTRGEITRDTQRVNVRANEAPDSTDTNTGGIIAGAAKGANQS